MDEFDAVGPEAQAILLLCSPVAGGAEGTKTFGPRGWAALSSRIASAGLDGPSALVGRAGAQVADTLGLSAGEGERIAVLLRRSGQLAFALERLSQRGIRALTLVDAGYPTRLTRLGQDAPPVLFVAGEHGLLERGGIAIVGSRDADPVAMAFTDRLASAAARAGTQVVSGGARGIDQRAMAAAFAGGGTVLGVLPEGIERRLRDQATRSAVMDGSATLLSPFDPAAGFTTGAAMARNKLIYALADVAVVVSSAAGEGGTWSGAVEALAGGWVPVLVRTDPDAPAGNAALLERGARPLPGAWDLEAATVADLLASTEPAANRARVAEDQATYEQLVLMGDGE